MLNAESKWQRVAAGGWEAPSYCVLIRLLQAAATIREHSLLVALGALLIRS